MLVLSECSERKKILISGSFSAYVLHDIIDPWRDANGKDWTGIPLGADMPLSDIIPEKYKSWIGGGCRICWLHLYRMVRPPPPTSVLI